MVNRADEKFYERNSRLVVNHDWLATQFDGLLERLAAMEEVLEELKQDPSDPLTTVPGLREFYSVAEFAERVDRNEYTVREWCRHGRIHAEKCETGRGDAKSWKIPVDELRRYSDHGLLPF